MKLWRRPLAFKLSPLLLFSFVDAIDFSSASVEVEFIADEGLHLTSNSLVHVLIYDDDIDEADSQFFVIQLVLVSGVNESLIKVNRNASVCAIFDNDCKLQ